MARVRGRDLSRCLVVAVDVGKSSAMALIADHYGEMVVAPFEFALTETGVRGQSQVLVFGHEKSLLLAVISTLGEL
ncbi:MAG: hypothetical protein M3063_09300 [Actinomycetota bacterium]|nr:hypothetical protein [Actinomycetota bacterium]